MALDITLVDLVKMQITSSGTSAFSLGLPDTGFRGTEALINGATYSYSVQQGSSWEYGRGTYFASSQTLSRGPIRSSNGNAAIELAVNGQISLVLLAEDVTGLIADAVAPFEQQIAVLLYKPPVISNFAVSPSSAEPGQTVSSVTLSWDLSGAAPTGQTLSWSGGGSAALAAGDTSKTITGLALTTDTTFTLTATDTAAPAGAVNSATVQVTLAVVARWYAGASASPSPSDSTLTGFAQQGPATTRARTFTINATGGRYPTYAWPASLGMLTSVRVGGFNFSDYSVTTRNVVNADGASVSMNVLVFNTLQNGAAIEVSVT